MLPSELQEAILAAASNCRLNDLATAREALTQRYKGERKSSQLIHTTAERLSYLLTRMPATYAAVEACLNFLLAADPSLREIHSVLDAGAGPATASWAAITTLTNIQQMTLIERDAELAQWGKKLAEKAPNPALTHAAWSFNDLTTCPATPPQDLVICSYALGEIPRAQRLLVLKWLWETANKALLIIEPGSKEGFECIRSARAHLLELGAQIAAPCPHAYACPMPANDWCHFSVRLERTWMHRYLKSGTLSYEDEKFSYVAAVRSEVKPYKGRIVSPPEKHSGHMRLRICAQSGNLELITLSRKDKEAYKAAKKLEWGDQFN